MSLNSKPTSTAASRELSCSGHTRSTALLAPSKAEFCFKFSEARSFKMDHSALDFLKTATKLEL